MKRTFVLMLLCFGSLSSLRAEESPPYEVKDPAATENFRNVYLQVDTLNKLSSLFSYITGTSSNSLCIDNPTFCVDALIHSVIVSTIQAGRGTLALPPYTFIGDKDTGMGSPAANAVSLIANGANMIRCDYASNVTFSVNGSAKAEVGTTYFAPAADSTLNLGDPTLGWKNLFLGDGTLALPSIAYSGDNDTGQKRMASGVVGHISNAAESFEVGSSSVTSFVQFIGKGTATNDSPASGYIGEVISTFTGTSINFGASTQYGDLVSVAFTAGDWMVGAFVEIVRNGAAITDSQMGIGTVAGNSGVGLTSGDTLINPGPLPATTHDESATLPPRRFSFSGTTTLYLKINATYSVATPKAVGRMTGWRIR